MSVRKMAVWQLPTAWMELLMYNLRIEFALHTTLWSQIKTVRHSTYFLRLRKRWAEKLWVGRLSNRFQFNQKQCFDLLSFFNAPKHKNLRQNDFYSIKFCARLFVIEGVEISRFNLGIPRK